MRGTVAVSVSAHLLPQVLGDGAEFAQLFGHPVRLNCYAPAGLGQDMEPNVVERVVNGPGWAIRGAPDSALSAWSGYGSPRRTNSQTTLLRT